MSARAGASALVGVRSAGACAAHVGGLVGALRCRGSEGICAVESRCTPRADVTAGETSAESAAAIPRANVTAGESAAARSSRCNSA
eukprot:7292419-Prymnesium_polylepis.1